MDKATALTALLDICPGCGTHVGDDWTWIVHMADGSHRFACSQTCAHRMATR